MEEKDTSGGSQLLRAPRGRQLSHPLNFPSQLSLPDAHTSFLSLLQPLVSLAAAQP